MIPVSQAQYFEFIAGNKVLVEVNALRFPRNVAEEAGGSMVMGVVLSSHRDFSYTILCFPKTIVLTDHECKDILDVWGRRGTMEEFPERLQSVASLEKGTRNVWVEDGVPLSSVTAYVTPAKSLGSRYVNSTDSPATGNGLHIGAKVIVRRPGSDDKKDAVIIGFNVEEHAHALNFAVEFDDGDIAEDLKEEELIPVNFSYRFIV